MDVRCERCKARYVIPDEKVPPAGLAVRCSDCGLTFKVRAQQQVIQVPATEAEATTALALAHARPGHLSHPGQPAKGEPATRWILKRADGSTQEVADLAAVQRLIAGRRAARGDELSKDDEPFMRLGDIPELVPMIALIETTNLVAPRPAAGQPAAPKPAAGQTAAGQTAAGQTAGGQTAAGRTAPPKAPASSNRAGHQVGRSRSKLTVASAIAALVVTAVLLIGLLVWSDTEPPRRSVPAPAGATSGATPGTASGTAPGTSPPAPQPGPQPIPAQPQAQTRAAQPPPAPRPPPAPAPAPAPVDRAQAFRYRIAQARALREGGETARALDAFGRLLQEEPKNAAVLAGRGLCYFEMNKYESAEASFKQALAAAPEDAEATMGLAETYRQTGKRAEATALYQRYLAVHPNGEEAAVARNALSQLKE